MIFLYHYSIITVIGIIIDNKFFYCLPISFDYQMPSSFLLSSSGAEGLKRRIYLSLQQHIYSLSYKEAELIYHEWKLDIGSQKLHQM